MSRESPPVPLESLLRHREWVRSLALRLVADPNTADDVEQQTWLEAMRHPPRHETSVRGWLGTVTRNAARKLGRGATRRTKHETAAPRRAPSRPADELVAEAEAGRHLVELVLSLDEPYRGTVLLRYFEGLDTGEIAARTGVPVETVRTRHKRAIAQLRERMDERHRGDRRAWAIALVGPGVLDRPWPSWGEGIVMGAAKKVAVAAAVVLVVGGMTWTLASGRGRDDAALTSTADAATSPRARDAGTASPAPVEASRNATRAARSSDIRTREASAPKTLFHVRVIWPDGGPPRDAVYLVGAMEAWMMGERKFAFIQSSPQPVPASGTFDVTLAAGQIEPTIVRVTADGFAQVESTLARPANGAAEDTVEIRLVAAPGGRLGGRVVVKGGEEGVEGAEIRVRLVDPTASQFRDVWAQNQPRPTIGPVVATTDARGVFETKWLPPGAHEVEAIATGFEWWKGRAEVPSSDLRVEIARTGFLTGRVRFADGTPAVGVLVRTARQDVYRGEATTDAEGRFRFEDVPSGGLTVWVCYQFDGSGANVRQQQLKRLSRAGDDIEIVAEPALDISGAIVLADGSPYRGSAIVRASPEGETHVAEGTGCRPNGTFTIRGLAEGRYRVSAQIYPPHGEPARRCEPIEGIEAGATGVRLVANSGLSIEGTVEIPPEAAESVSKIAWRASDSRAPGGYVAAVEPDRAGRFRIDGLDPGRVRLVFQSYNGHDSPWQAGDAAIVDAGSTEVHLKLSTASTISGRVSLGGGAVLSCDVWAVAVGDEKDAVSVHSFGAQGFSGRFTFVGLDPSKRWTLTARREGLVTARAESVAVGTTGIDLALTRGLFVKGRVVRADGSTAARVPLRLESAIGGLEAAGYADEKGEIVTEALAPGEYVVKAWDMKKHPGWPATYVEIGRVRAGDANVELRLPR